MAEEDEIVLPAELGALSTLVSSNVQNFHGRGDEKIKAAALHAAKFVFDQAVKSESRAIPHLTSLFASLLAPTSKIETRASKKRKRESEERELKTLQPTPVGELHVDGMDDEQIWAQLELRAKVVCEMMSSILEKPAAAEDEEGEDTGVAKRARANGVAAKANDSMELDGGDDEGSDDDDEFELEDDSDEDDSDTPLFNLIPGASSPFRSSEDEEEDDEEEDLGEGVLDLRDPSSGSATASGSDDEDEFLVDLDRPSRSKKFGKGGKGHPTLDDGFFSLADFNAEIEEAEARTVSRGKLGKSSKSDAAGMDVDAEGAEDDEESDDDVDLFAPVDGDSGMGAFDEDDLEDTGSDPFYSDFFSPPKRKVKPATPQSSSPTSSPSPTKSSPKKRPRDEESSPVPDAPRKTTVRFDETVKYKNIKAVKIKNRITSLEDLMALLAREEAGAKASGKARSKGMTNGTGKRSALVLDDESEDEDEEWDGGDDEDEDGGSGESSEDEDDETEDLAEEEGDDARATIDRFKDDLFAEDEEPQSEESPHATALTSLTSQIRALEAENVAPKAWTLRGEASARQRPLNSLLEEHLEFEHVQKVVPVVTEERVKGLEDVIKARILENRFDDVVRRRPVSSTAYLPSSSIPDVSTAKSSQSLAQIYEDQYTAALNGGGVLLDDRDGKLKKEHDEIEKNWEAICYKLDALCNAHFMPKPPKATITTVSNVASATLESALPTTQSTTTLLAPEELFASAAGAGVAAAKSKDGVVRSREEMTPAEKRRVRERTKEKKRRAVGAGAGLLNGSSVKNGMSAGKKVKGKERERAEKEAALKQVVRSGRGVTVVGKASKMGKREGPSLDGRRLKL